MANEMTSECVEVFTNKTLTHNKEVEDEFTGCFAVCLRFEGPKAD
jgi:hypothetical protein